MNVIMLSMDGSYTRKQVSQHIVPEDSDMGDDMGLRRYIPDYI